MGSLSTVSSFHLLIQISSASSLCCGYILSLYHLCNLDNITIKFWSKDEICLANDCPTFDGTIKKRGYPSAFWSAGIRSTYSSAFKSAGIGLSIPLGREAYPSAFWSAGIGSTYSSTFKSAGIGLSINIFLINSNINSSNYK